MSDIFEQVQQTIAAIQSETPDTAEALEIFRIKYLGTKGEIKSIMEEMRNVPNERKREFGQLVNNLKQVAEEKFQTIKSALEAAATDATVASLDLTRPAEPMPLGARHPVSITMNRIIKIFEKKNDSTTGQNGRLSFTP